MAVSDIPWEEMRRRAREATRRSYAPYSHVRVGACATREDGLFLEGSNVENASYGVTLCAECSLVSDLIRHGGGRLVAVSVVAGDGDPIAPCGRCRQVLYEHGGADLLLDQGDTISPVAWRDLLPLAFGPDDVVARRTPSA